MTFQAASVANVESVRASFSNIVTIPRTAVSDALFQNAQKPSSETLRRYNTIPAKLVRGGIDILGNGAALLMRSTAQEHEVTMYSGNFNLKNWLGDKSLRDLLLNYTQFNWSAQAIRDGLLLDLNTEKVVYAVYAPDLTGTFTQLEVAKTFPVVQVTELIRRMFDGSGLQVEGTLFDHPLIQQLVIPAFYPYSSFVWAVTGNFEEVLAPTFEPVWTSAQNAEGAQIDSVDGITPQGKSLIVTKPFLGGALRLALSANQGIFTSFAYDVKVTRGTTVFTLNVNSNPVNLPDAQTFVFDQFDLLPGDVIDVELSVTPLGPELLINVFLNQNAENVIGQPFYVERQLPDILQIDFLKSILLLACAYPITDDNTVTFNRYDTLSETAPTFDIAQFLQLRSVEASYIPDGYGQNNLFEYSGDDAQYNSSFTVNSKHVEGEKKFTSIYHTPGKTTLGNVECVRFPLYDTANSVFFDQVAPFIGYVEQAAATFNIDGVPYTQTGVNFVKFEPFLAFSSLLRTFWGTLSAMQNKAYRLSVEAYLSVRELAQIDFKKPVTISKGPYSGVYFVERIENYTDASTKCSVILVKVER